MGIGRAIIALLGLLLLAACGPEYRTTYHYTPPPSAEGKHCVAQCQTTQTYCRTNCGHEERSCRQDARWKAQRDYDRYVDRQLERGRKIDRSPSSFESSYHCNDSSCEARCNEDFRICYNNCGGTVTSTTRCVSGCDQK